MRSDDAMRAVVVGAGGLGGPIAIALAGGGVDVVIVDADVVELSNLHRQVQFGMADLRMPKAIALAARIGPTARGVVGRFDPTTADELLREADLVVDGSDDPPTKFLVADSARARGIPYVIASALRYGGNVFASARDAACYRCLFEDAPARDEAPTCGDSGVLGPLVGWVGGVAAERALRLMVGDSHGAANVAATIWVLDDLRRGRPRELAIARRPGCVCDGAPTRDRADPAAPAPTGGA
ncbi:MAG TPA: ThiF family adenylyltransferase [Kofleriaceae bacterium]|nr:ThiF family adenylyltransferase [Kofleriaceae bacterium]